MFLEAARGGRGASAWKSDADTCLLKTYTGAAPPGIAGSTHRSALDTLGR